MSRLPSRTEETILRVLRNSPNHQNDAWTIALAICQDGLGQFHLAIANVARALARRGLIIIRPGQSQYHPEWYALTEQGKFEEEPT